MTLEDLDLEGVLESCEAVLVFVASGTLDSRLFKSGPSGLLLGELLDDRDFPRPSRLVPSEIKI